MISKNNFMNNIAKLDIAYPSFNMLLEENETRNLWYESFKHEAEDLFENGVDYFIRTSTFVPTVAGLRKSMVECLFPIKSTAEETWKKVGIYIRKYGTYISEEKHMELDECTRKILKSMGGFRAVCTSTNQEVSRAQFMRLYKDEVEEPKQKALRTPILSIGIRQYILKLDTENVEQIDMKWKEK